MRTIFKYPTPPLEDKFTLKLPEGAEILCVQYDKISESSHVWVLIDTEMPEEIRTFVLIQTGHPIDEDADINYIGTYSVDGFENGFVGHLFELTNP